MDTAVSATKTSSVFRPSKPGNMEPLRIVVQMNSDGTKIKIKEEKLILFFKNSCSFGLRNVFMV